MAKKSKIHANERRKRVVAEYAARRAALKELLRTAGTAEEREAAVRALSRLPRDASPVRVRNRDQVDGRPRGYIGKVGADAVTLRHLRRALLDRLDLRKQLGKLPHYLGLHHHRGQWQCFGELVSHRSQPVEPRRLHRCQGRLMHDHAPARPATPRWTVHPPW